MNNRAPTRRAVATALLAGMIAGGTAHAAAPCNVANVDLRVTEGPNDNNRTYKPIKKISVPATHTIGDYMFPYEGIGWENDIVGYRIYLDERSVADVFGKRTNCVALPTMDYRNKYHELADWGMDVMHVGPSMGVGGLGIYRDGKIGRFGKDARLSAEVLRTGGKVASFRLNHLGVAADGGKSGDVTTTYSLATGSPLTWVSVRSTLPANTLVTGLVAHPRSQTITPASPVNGWSYIARWGDTWSENKDGVGIVLFYRVNEVERLPYESETVPLRFTTANPRYAFAGVWSKGPQGIDSRDKFEAFLAATLPTVSKR